MMTKNGTIPAILRMYTAHFDTTRQRSARLIKQITKEDIGIRNYQKSLKDFKLEPGDIIRFGSGSFY